MAAGRHTAAAVSSYVFLVSLLMYFAVGDVFLRHHDIGWHIATGDLIREMGKIPAADPWSFSANGYPWLNLSWLWDVDVSLLYRLGGFAALIAATILIGGAISVLLAQFCLRAGATPAATVIGVLWVAATLPLYQGPLDYAMAAAPQTWSLLMFLLFWFALDRGKLAWLPVLMCVWANTHGAFLLAYVLLGAYLIDAAWNKNPARKKLFLVSLACMVAMLINPLGIHVLDATLRTLTGPASGTISEFLPFTFGRDALSSIYLLAAIFLIDWRNKSIPLAHRLLAMGFMALGLIQTRSFCYLMFTTLPLLLAGLKLPPRWQAFEARCAEDCERPGVAKRMIILCCVVAVALWPAAAMRWKNATLPDDIAPMAEIDYIAGHFPGERIYNHWNLGSFIIFKTRGKIPVIIDGRGGTAYPPELLAMLAKYNNEREALDLYHLNVALMPRYLPALLTYFDTSPEWKLAFQGKAANVYVRCAATKSCH